MAAAPKESLSAASVRGDARMLQNPSKPSDQGLRTKAANGISTMADRQKSTNPSDKPKPGKILLRALAA
jgi:hypothetical protein